MQFAFNLQFIAKSGQFTLLIIHLFPPIFTALGHWELSHSTTTNHLLSVIAITNTLVSVSNASFIPEQERRRKLVRQATHGAMDISGQDQGFSHIQEQIKKGWSLLSTLHCLLLSGKLRHLGSNAFKKPNVEQLAIRYKLFLELSTTSISKKLCYL